MTELLTITGTPGAGAGPLAAPRSPQSRAPLRPRCPEYGEPGAQPLRYADGVDGAGAGHHVGLFVRRRQRLRRPSARVALLLRIPARWHRPYLQRTARTIVSAAPVAAWDVPPPSPPWPASMPKSCRCRTPRGRFLVHELLGRGATATVFRALTFPMTARWPSRWPRAAEKDASRIHAEARMLASLDHPAVVRFIAAGTVPAATSGGTAVLVEEFAYGGSLAERIRAAHAPRRMWPAGLPPRCPDSGMCTDAGWSTETSSQRTSCSVNCGGAPCGSPTSALPRRPARSRNPAILREPCTT